MEEIELLQQIEPFKDSPIYVLDLKQAVRFNQDTNS